MLINVCKMQYGAEMRKINAKKRQGEVISYDESIADNFTIEDTLKSDLDIEDELINKLQKRKLYDLICKLPEKEKFVIQKMLEEHTQYEIAEMLNMSQANVSRITKRAINNLRKGMI